MQLPPSTKRVPNGNDVIQLQRAHCVETQLYCACVVRPMLARARSSAAGWAGQVKDNESQACFTQGLKRPPTQASSRAAQIACRPSLTRVVTIECFLVTGYRRRASFPPVWILGPPPVAERSEGCVALHHQRDWGAATSRHLLMADFLACCLDRLLRSLLREPEGRHENIAVIRRGSTTVGGTDASRRHAIEFGNKPCRTDGRLMAPCESRGVGPR